MAYRKPPELDEDSRRDMQAELRAEKRRADAALKTLGSAVRDALANGFTTREIGVALNVSASTVSRWAKL